MLETALIQPTWQRPLDQPAQHGLSQHSPPELSLAVTLRHLSTASVARSFHVHASLTPCLPGKLGWGVDAFMVGGCRRRVNFVLVPGPGDAGPGSMLPQPPLPRSLTADLRARIPGIVFASNPCRLRYCTQEIVIFRQDLLKTMRRHCLLTPVGRYISCWAGSDPSLQSWCSAGRWVLHLQPGCTYQKFNAEVAE